MEANLAPLSRGGSIELPWTWCARCQRVHRTGETRGVTFTADALHPHPATLQLCPYFDCSANIRLHGWHWAIIRQQHPEYPTKPERDVIYIW